MQKTKSVSTFWQCLATLSFPTGLLAFKRINKLRNGLLIYASTTGLTFVATYLFNQFLESGIIYLTFSDNLFLILILTILLSTLITPIYYINKWSKEWNNQVTEILR